MKIGSLLLALAAALPILAGNRDIDTPLRIIAGNTTHATAIFAADFTSDGKPDVLQVESGKLRVLPGTAATLFGTPILTDLGNGILAEGLADFNADGRPDLYLRTNTGAAIMDGNANGTFAAARPVSVTYAASQLATGDFDGDGLLDLAAAGQGHLVVYRGEGNGNFSSPYDIAVDTNELFDLAAGDFDGDTKIDLLVARRFDNVVAWNTGTSFTTTSLGGSGRSAAAGDVNGDGITDAVVSDGADARIWFGAASRTLTETKFKCEELSFFEVSTDVTLAPLDGDARPEILLTIDDGVVVLSHDGTSFRNPHVYQTLVGSTNGIAAADFDADGHTDVVRLGEDYVEAPPEGEFSLIRGRGDGSLRSPAVFDLRMAVKPYILDISPVVAGNLNGDAAADMVLHVRLIDEAIATLLARSDGTFAPPVVTTMTPFPGATFSRIHEAGDLNADGRLDVVRHVRLNSQSYRFQTWFGQSNGTFLAGPITNTTAPAEGVQRILDFTGDGHADILDSSGNLYPGSGNGAFGAAIATGMDFWYSDKIVFGDFNNDTRPDVFVYGNASTVYINNGGGSFTSAPSPIPFGLTAIIDMNGDSVNDAVIGGVMLGTGGGAFTANRVFELDHGLAKVADFDGDGHRDVATSQMIYYGTGTGTFDDAAQTSMEDATLIGNEIALFATADFDGNGSPDLWRAAYGVVTIVPTRTGIAGTVAPQLTASTDPDPSPWREAFDIVATIAAAPVRPRGGVLFSVEGTPYAIARVAEDGVAFDTHTWFAIGSSPTLGVTFLGDEHYGAASASTSHSTGKARTILTFTGPTSFPIGATVFFTGALSRFGGTPTGTITYRKGDTILATRDVSESQVVSITDRALFPLGTHTISASYSGDASYLPAERQVQITITKIYPSMTLTFPPAPIMSGQHTISVSFPNHPAVTGTVTFACFGTPLGTVTVANAQVSLLAHLPAGEGSCSATYSGDAEFQSRTLPRFTTVYRGTFPMAPGVTASRLPGSSFTTINIQPVHGATSYDVYRGVDGAPLALTQTTPSLNFDEYSTLPLMTTAVYAVVARDASGNLSPMGPKDIVTSVTFNDPNLSGVLIKALHATQLQSAINAVRRAAGLQQIAFNGPLAGTSVTFVRLSAMRNALYEARNALGIPTSFTEATPSVIRAIHIEELRNGVK